MNTPDKFTVEFLDDGTIKFMTDSVSAANHVSADNLIKETFRLLGGEVEVQHREGKKVHYHRAENIQSLEAGGHGHTH